LGPARHPSVDRVRPKVRAVPAFVDKTHP
jgi:hypothetical protein